MPTAKFDGFSGYRVAGQEPSAEREVAQGTRVAVALEFHIEAFGPMQRPPSAPHGSPAPDAVGLDLEKAIARVTKAGFIAVVFQPERSVEDLAVSRQSRTPGRRSRGSARSLSGSTKDDSGFASAPRRRPSATD
jgi:hypothetical protein